MRTVKELESLLDSWVESGKKTKIVASFTDISQLTDEHKRHFTGAEYLWKPMNGDIFGGVLIDDNLDYVHLVLATGGVLTDILKLKPTT